MWQNAHNIPLGVRWCAMHIFLFLRLYNFIDRIVRIYIFFKNFRSLLFYSLAQVFITFNISDVFLLNKLMSKYGKRIVLVFYIYCINLKKKSKSSFSHSFLAIYSLLVLQQISSFILEQVCFEKTLLTGCWFSCTWCPFCSLHMQIYLLNSCKLDWEENIFDF